MKATTIITLPALVDEWATAENLRGVRSVYDACMTAPGKVRVEYNGKRYSNADLFKILQQQKVYRSAEAQPVEVEELDELDELDALEEVPEDSL